MLLQNRQTAYRLADGALRFTDLDIISSNVGLRFLCRAELLNGQYSEEQAEQFLMISLNNEQRAKQKAHALFQKKQ